MKQIFYILILLSFLDNNLYGQKIDSITNIPKNKFWGNSWSFGASYNISKNREYGFNIGRTLKSVTTYRHAQEYNMKLVTWGLGYSYYKKGNINGQTLSAFGEFSNFYWPPLTTRIEYIYDFTTNNHYIRPSIGFYGYVFEILYTYSFVLTDKTNVFNHGITFKIKIFTNSNNWLNIYKNQYYKKNK